MAEASGLLKSVVRVGGGLILGIIAGTVAGVLIGISIVVIFGVI
jgi:ABC-type nitrate/sulfonate/bicarbonate transport system permease component